MEGKKFKLDIQLVNKILHFRINYNLFLQPYTVPKERRQAKLVSSITSREGYSRADTTDPLVQKIKFKVINIRSFAEACNKFSFNFTASRQDKRFETSF